MLSISKPQTNLIYLSILVGRLDLTRFNICKMATPAGIEPALSDVTDRCFNQLNYGAICSEHSKIRVTQAPVV